MKSKFLSINGKDLLEGFAATVVTGISTALLDSLTNTPIVFNVETLKHAVVGGLVGGLVWLLKNFTQNSEGKLLKKEPVQKN